MKGFQFRYARTTTILLLILVLGRTADGQEKATGAPAVPRGFTSLFNGQDFTGWTLPEGDNGHWKVVDGVIDYDALSEAAPGKRHVWSEKEYADFVLMADWKIKEPSGTYDMPIVLADGTNLKDDSGAEIKLPMPNADSGIFLRGEHKSQVNIWCWPVGSGEVFGYRNDMTMPAEVRAGVTPKMRADNPIGEWNTFVIVMVGERLTVILNGHQVIENARLPGVPASGRLALQSHGGIFDGELHPASSLVQFRNIFIREL